MKKRQKYSNGGSISASKSFKGVGDLDLSFNASASGNQKNINKSASATVSGDKGSFTARVTDNDFSSPESSYRATLKTGKNSRVGATKNKYQESLDFNTKTDSGVRFGVEAGKRNGNPFANLTVSKPL
jgi:hypothetical protein